MLLGNPLQTPMNSLRETLLTLPPSTYNCLYINRQALSYNYAYLQQRVGSVTCGAVVKADAYNLGIEPIASTLVDTGCNVFFVAYLDEGISLRKCLGSHDAEIYVFNGFLQGCEEDFIHYNLIPVITDLDQMESWKKQAQKMNQRLSIALHFDTGMRRTGLPLEQLSLFPSQSPKELTIKLVMSHMACADVPRHVFNTIQYSRFLKINSHFSGIPASLANSNAIFLDSSYHFQVVRPGKALYGLNPLLDQPNPMHPVVSLWAKIYQLQTIHAQETIGYSQTYKAKKTERVATITIGYADGVPWLMENQGLVMIQGFPAPIIGRISMDLLTVNVTDVPESLLFPGQWVELIGNEVNIEKWATHANSISYEILLGLGKRLTRVYSE